MKSNRQFKLIFFITSIIVLLLANSAAYASTTIFTLTPLTRAPNQIISGQTATAVYRVTNNTSSTLSNTGVINLPATVTQVTGGGLCGSTFNLASGQSCNLELQISGAVFGGPRVCFSKNRPAYCSQPTSNNQLNVKVVSAQ